MAPFKLLAYFLSVSLLTLGACKNNTAYVDSNKLLQGYHGATAQHELFQAKAQGWQQRVDSLSSELQALSKASAVTQSTKTQQMLRYRDAIQQQAQQENQRLTQAVLAEINAYLKQYGKEEGYTFILGATESGNIVYAAEGTNITEDVLKGLNAQYDRQHSSPTR